MGRAQASFAQVVVTHDVADFDAVASAFAATRLYPEAVVVRRRLDAPAVHDFLALHKDRFPRVSHELLARQSASVRRLVVVDVRRQSRLADFEPLLERVAAHDAALEVCVYDHHEPAFDDLPATHAVVEPVGAAVTLLVEEIERRGIAIDDVEATLFALGIHADTGSLSYPRATPRDARALAGLMERGASLDMIQRYLHPALGAEQLDLLSQILRGLEVTDIAGRRVGIVVIEMSRTIGKMARVVAEAFRLSETEALFAVFVIGGKKTQVIARSTGVVVDVGSVLGGLGGGGHAGAASATLRAGTGESVRTVIEAALERDGARPRTVRSLMTTAVRTVDARLPLRDAAASLRAWACRGAPVVRDGVLVGVLSHRDVDRALRAGDSRLPTGAYMTSPPRTIGPDATLEEALTLMTRRDIGRLPVVDDGGALVGIVSRTDLLQALYRGHGPSMDEDAVSSDDGG